MARHPAPRWEKRPSPEKKEALAAAIQALLEEIGEVEVNDAEILRRGSILQVKMRTVRPIGRFLMTLQKLS